MPSHSARKSVVSSTPVPEWAKMIVELTLSYLENRILQGGIPLGKVTFCDRHDRQGGNIPPYLN
jgi:hypothetical protein